MVTSHYLHCTNDNGLISGGPHVNILVTFESGMAFLRLDMTICSTYVIQYNFYDNNAWGSIWVKWFFSLSHSQLITTKAYW